MQQAISLTETEVRALVKAFAISPSTDLKRHDLIGRSLVGNVYKGYWITGGKEVAIKQVPVHQPQLLEQLLQKFRVAASDCLRVRNYDNLVACYGVWDKPPAACLVFEYSQIGSLRSVLANTRMYPLSWEDRCSLANDIAKGMRFLHRSLGIMHGKLTSSNVLLFKQGGRLVAKVSDYGLLPLQQMFEQRQQLIRSGSTVSDTRQHMRKVPSWENDVYDYGALVYELLTGDELKPNSSSIDTTALPFSAECPQDLSSIICNCLHANPESRPTFEQVVKALQRVLDDFLMLSTSTDNLNGTVTPFNQVTGSTTKSESSDHSHQPRLHSQGFTSFPPRVPSERAFTFAEMEAICRELSTLEDGPCLHATQLLAEFARSSKANHEWLRSTCKPVELLVKAMLHTRSEDLKIHIAHVLENIAVLGEPYRALLITSYSLSALRKLLKSPNHSAQDVALSALCVVLHNLEAFEQLSHVGSVSCVGDGVSPRLSSTYPPGSATPVDRYDSNLSTVSGMSTPASINEGSSLGVGQSLRVKLRAMTFRDPMGDDLEAQLRKLVPLLVVIGRSGDDAAAAKAFFVLTELLSVARLRRSVVPHIQLIPVLIGCLSNGSVPCKTHAAELLWHLVTAGEANALEAIHNNAVGTLISLLQANPNDDRLRGAAIACLSHLARQPKGASLIHQLGGVEVALDLLNSGNLPVLEASTAMLSLLAESADAQRLLASQQGVPKLLNAMATESVKTQANAAKCLRLMAENCEYHQEFLSCNAVEGFVQRLKVAAEPQLRSELAFLLFYFAQHMHSSKLPLLEAIGAMDVLEKCLQLPMHSQKAEFIVCECCTRALTDIAGVSSTARQKLASGNATRQLAVLLHTSNKGCRDAALCALTTLAVEPGVRQSIVSYGIMEPVLKLLDTDTPELQQMSVELVARLAQEVENRVEIAPAIPALDKLLYHEDTQQWAATALAYLTEEPRLAASIADLPGVLSTLLENIENGDKACQRPITELLKNICELVPSARQAVCAIPDAVQQLLAIVSTELDSTRQRCLRTLLALSDDLNHRCKESAVAFAAQFKAAEGCGVIAELLRSPAPSDTYQAALGLLWNVSLRKSQDHVCAGPDAEMLVRFLCHHDVTCQQAAAGVISCITFNNRANQAAIVEAQGVPPLMSMLTEGHEQLHSTALDAICNVSYSNPAAQQAVCASDGINMLRRFVERGSPKQQVAAALVYRNLAQDAQLRHQVIHSGALSAIVSMIMSGRRPGTPTHRDDITICYLAACNALSTITHNDRELLEVLATTKGLFDQIMHVWLSCGTHEGLLLSTSALIYSFITHVPSVMPDLSIEVLGRLLSMLEADHPAKLEAGANLLCGVTQAHGSTVEYMLLEVGGLPRVAKLLESRWVKVRLCGVRALLGLAISEVVRDHMDKVALEPVLRKMAQELSGGDREAVDTLMLYLGII